jgi:N-acetylglucosamine-6-phosphate deacetylase
MPLLFINADMILPDDTRQRGWLRTDGGRIHSLGAGEPPAVDGPHTVIDANGLILMPGLIDVHIHGMRGADAMDAVPEALQAISGALVKHGVTGWLPTTWTALHLTITAALQAIAGCMGPVANGATIYGAHMEGPYLNIARCGYQNVQFIRRARPDEARELFESGALRIMSLAPEFTENHWLIDECIRRGIVVSAAHTDATYEQMIDAFRRGVQRMTHVYNAMSGFNHRAPGAVGAALVTPGVRCEAIADGHHLHQASLKLLHQIKGADGVTLVSDCHRPAGMPDGTYLVSGRMAMLTDGTLRRPDGRLAGSTITLNRALLNYMRALDEPIEKVWRTATLNPARDLGLDGTLGSLTVGKQADLALFDAQMHAHVTVTGGAIAYHAPESPITI